MYTSVDSRSSNPQRGQPAKLAVNPRWALNLNRILTACSKPVGESHTVKPISMREHVTPLQQKHKGESVDSAVRSLLINQAWSAIFKAVIALHGQGKKHYAGSNTLSEDVQVIIDRLKPSFRDVVVVSHAKANIGQRDSLLVLLKKAGFNVRVEMSPCEAFIANSLVIGASQFINNFATLDYYMEGPMSVPDVEGNDVQWRPHFKVEVNHSEAIGVIAWKNYNGFNF